MTLAQEAAQWHGTENEGPERLGRKAKLFCVPGLGWRRQEGEELAGMNILAHSEYYRI